MLLIFPKPAEIAENNLLAVNLMSYNEIVMSTFIDNDKLYYSLVIIKRHDGHGSNHSITFYTLGTFESHEKCLELFQAILGALNDGQKTFDLPSFSMPVEPEPSNPTNQRGGFL